MDMSFDPKAISGLFAMSRDAVLGISGEAILFLNQAAADLLQAKPGDPAKKHVPEYILSDPAEQFIASVRVDDRSGYVSVSRAEDFLLVSYALPPRENSIPPVLSGSVRELSNALMATRLAADVLLKKLDDTEDEKLRTHSAILYQSYYRMKRLCEHIGKADALQRGAQPFSPRVVALDQICADLCDSLNHFLSPMGIVVECQAEPGYYNTLADQALLETLLLNAVSNSAAHLSGKENSRIRIGLSLRGGRIILAIDDNGSGIPGDILGHATCGNTPASLSDPAAGAGLGLMVCRGIAELHGGALILESREGVGTKMRVSMPIRLPEEPILRTPDVPYNREGMSHLLTELSVILDKKFYSKNFFD